MTRDDILRMAREAGITFKPMVVDGVEYQYRHVHCNDNIGEDEADCIERFASLVAAAEREECAMIVLSRRIGYAVDDADLNSLASEIRARGQK